MHCPNCGQEIAQGKFCTNCGAQLSDNESIPTQDPTIHTTEQQQPTANHEQPEQVRQNQTVEKLKTAGADFGHFFVTLLKKPSEAKHANSNDLVSSIVTIIIFALVLALGVHLTFHAFSSGYFGEPDFTFFTTFVLPFVEFILLFLVVAALTLAGGKIAAQQVTYADVLAKYGAYLIPYLLLYAAGFIIAFIGLSSLSIAFIFLSMIGALMIIPTIILSEQPAKGFDRIYILMAIYFISLLVCSFFLQSFAETLINSVFGSMMDGFGGY